MTIAILSWAAHETLSNTLKSYKKYGLDQLDDDRVIFFQEYSKEDRAIAKEYGWESIGSPENIGIAEAYKLLVAFASGDLFLFLENDWELIERPEYVIWNASDMLRNGVIDVAKLRHRTNPGEPLWSRQFKGRELERPEFLLDSIHWTDPLIFSPLIEPLDLDQDFGCWVSALAKNANWTNNPTMFRTEWLREYIVDRIDGDIEVNLQEWWKEQPFVVGQGNGLFTHNRLDR